MTENKTDLKDWAIYMAINEQNKYQHKILRRLAWILFWTIMIALFK